MKNLLLLLICTACTLPPPPNFGGCELKAYPEMGSTVPAGECWRVLVVDGDALLTFEGENACELGTDCLFAREGQRVVPNGQEWRLPGQSQSADFLVEAWPCDQEKSACEAYYLD